MYTSGLTEKIACEHNNDSRLMLFMEITWCKKQIKTLCGRNVEFIVNVRYNVGGALNVITMCTK
jgi:hypothetical protein